MPLSESTLRYLLAIYETAQSTMEVSSRAVAALLGVTKPSVAHTLNLLARECMIVKKRYGKIYLTDRGVFTARYYRSLVETCAAQFPDVGFALTDEEKRTAALHLVCALPSGDYTARCASLFDSAEE